MRAAILIALLATGCASQPFDKWTTADTARQAALTTLIAVDWAQTREIARNPNYYERNPVMGKHPTSSEVDLYFAASLLIHTAFPAMLNPRNRKIWQYVWMGERAAWVVNNHRVGIRIQF